MERDSLKTFKGLPKHILTAAEMIKRHGKSIEVVFRSDTPTLSVTERTIYILGIAYEGETAN